MIRDFSLVFLLLISDRRNLHRDSRPDTEQNVPCPYPPPKLPPGVLRGELYLAYAHSQTSLEICTKFGANRSSRLTASPNI